MAFVTTPIGFNFRGIPSSFTDVAPDIRALIPKQDAGAGMFDELIGYGWVDATVEGPPTEHWRGGPVGRIIGAAFTVPGQPRTFKVNLEPGIYRLGLGMYGQTGARLEIKDGLDSRLIILPSGFDNSNNFALFSDAAGVVSSDSTWGVNNASGYDANASTVEIACASGSLEFHLSHSGANGNIYAMLSHIRLVQVNSFNPPTVTDQPDDIEVTHPATATFSAVLGGGAYTGLRWQTRPSTSGSVSDVDGAVSTSYTTPATVISDHGKQYRLAVDWQGGIVYSNWATLYVNDGPPGVILDTTTVVTSESTCTFSWSNGTPPGSSFVVQMESPYNSNNWVTPSGSFLGNSFLATTLPDNTDLRFRVRPINAAGTSSYTTGVIFRVDNLVTGGDVVETVLLFTQLFNWSILGSTSTSFSFNWSILNKVLTDLGFDWNILSRVDRQLIYTWIIGETSSGTEIDYDRVALTIMNFVLTNGKTVQEQLLLLEKQNNVSIALSA